MIIHDDCLNALKDIQSNSIDLILTDPPYLISRKSYFSNTNEKTPEKMNIKYGNHSIDFGDWDKEDINWDQLFSEYKRVLKDGGTLIFFFDIWKSTIIKELADKYKFKQPRVCQWEKSNPVPINSSVNYLSNANEYFFIFINGKKPTFNSKYDKGNYKYPLCHGKERLEHPTQKPLQLIIDLVLKHSNPGDLVLDTFGGSGTTAEACILTKREYTIIEKDDKYIDLIRGRINKLYI